MTWLSRFISEYSGYCLSRDYVQGVLVELTGIAIEIALLSILVPLVLYLIRRSRTRYVRSMVDFYLFQIFHKITRMSLNMASIDDINPILIKQMLKDPEFKIYAHNVYGNLENILFVLNDTFSNPDAFRAEIEKKSKDDFLRYRDISDGCLEEVDRLSAMLIGLPRVQENLFNMRILVYGLRDMMERTAQKADEIDSENSMARFFYSNDVMKQAILLTKTVDIIFRKRRKLIDSMTRHREWFSKLRLLLSLPCLWVERCICRLRGKPYPKHGYSYQVPPILPDLVAYAQHQDKTKKETGAVNQDEAPRTDSD